MHLITLIMETTTVVLLYIISDKKIHRLYMCDFGFQKIYIP